MNGGITSGYPVSWHEISLPEKTNKLKSAEKKAPFVLHCQKLFKHM